MSEETQNQANELEVLKGRARMLGITFSNNIRVETLREKINAKLNDEEPDTDSDTDETEAETTADEDGDGGEQEDTEAQEETSEEAPKVQNPLQSYADEITAINNDKKLKPTERKMKIRQVMQKEQMRLIRLRITNLDPKKKDLPGEIFTVANKYIGTIRRRRSVAR